MTITMLLENPIYIC